MPLGTKVGLGPGSIVLNVIPTPHGKGHSTPITFRNFALARSPISATLVLQGSGSWPTDRQTDRETTLLRL